MLIEDDAHVCQEVCRDFFAFDIDPAQYIDRHLQPWSGFGHCHEFLGNGHRMEGHALTGTRHMGKGERWGQGERWGRVLYCNISMKRQRG